MPLEIFGFLNTLVPTNPTSGDPASHGDDQIRGIKYSLRYTFPNIAGAVTVTHGEINSVVARGLISGQTWTGTHDYSAGILRAAAPVGATDVATKNYADSLAYAATIAPRITRVPRTTNVVIGAADVTKFIDITSGTFTQTFAAAATLGPDWYIYLRNNGTGDITLDPSGAELIDGLASYIMYPGEARLIVCDGAALTSMVVSPFSKTFTATANFVKPPGYNVFEGVAWSGGNSGQRTNNATNLSQGGGGGGYVDFVLRAAALAASELVTIGGGAAGQTLVANGLIGGTTSLGSLVSVYAGTTFYAGGSTVSGLETRGVSNNLAPVAYEGGRVAIVGTNDFSMNSIKGGAGSSSTTGSPSSGNAIFGAAAGGSCYPTGAVSTGGVSQRGGNGGNAVSAANGMDGQAPGGGGGATQTGLQSGAGARGELRIWGKA